MKYCIFVERIFDDKCFNALKRFCISQHELIITSNGITIEKHPGKIKLFCLTPANYDLIRAEQGYTGTKEELSKIMAKRYKELESIGFNIELHLHLGLRLENLNQKKIFEEALLWMWKNSFDIGYWTAGWYIYNNESINIAERNGIEYFKDNKHYSFHDYEYDKIFDPMMIITNIRGLLRF